MSVHVSDELFSAEIDGALMPAEADELTAHVEACAGCRQRRDLMRATAGAVAGLPGVAMPRPLDLSFLPHRSAPPVPLVLAPRRWRPPVWVAPVLASAAVLLVAVTVAPRLLHAGSGASTAAGTGLAGGSAAPDTSRFSQSTTAAPAIGAPAAPNPGSGAPDSLTAPGIRGGTSQTFPDADGLVITLSPDRSTAAAGQPLELTLQARAAQPVPLRGLSLQVGQDGGSLIAKSSAPALSQGQQAGLTATWTAGRVGGATRPGNYVLEGTAILADGRTFSVRLTLHVS